MPLAFGHLLGAWIPAQLYCHWRKYRLQNLSWFLLLLGSVLPDIDYVASWLLQIEIHRTFTHSLLFVIILLIASYLIASSSQFKNEYALVLSAGALTHLILDAITSPGVPLFWPSLYYFSLAGVKLVANPNFNLFQQTPKILQQIIRHAIIDLALGTGWILYLTLRKKIKH